MQQLRGHQAQSAHVIFNAVGCITSKIQQFYQKMLSKVNKQATLTRILTALEGSNRELDATSRLQFCPI